MAVRLFFHNQHNTTQHRCNMNKKTTNDLSEFKDWIALQKGISSRTISVYACNIRKILSRCQNLSTQSLDQYLSDPSHSNGVRSNLYTSWNAFADFTKSKGISLPMPTPRNATSKIDYTLPIPVLHAFAEINKFNKLRIESMADRQYQDFKLPPRGSMYELRHPHREWEITLIPKKPLEKIFQWGNPLSADNIPVFPVEPMSQGAIPKQTLKKIWKEYKQDYPN